MLSCLGEQKETPCRSMEGRGGARQDASGNENLLYSERKSRAKAPRTPNLREASPNYDEEMDAISGRSTIGERSRRQGDDSLTSYESRRSPPSTGRSGDGDQRLLISDRRGDKMSRRKREKPTEGQRLNDSGEGYKQKHDALAARKRRSDCHFLTASRRSSKRTEHGRSARSARYGKDARRKSGEFNRRDTRIWDEAGIEEESSCTLSRVKIDIVPASQVSDVHPCVQAQPKIRDKYPDALNRMCDVNDGRPCVQPTQTKTLTQQKAVEAVLTFQHWCHKQMKKLFSIELKKLLEEAKEDESYLAQLEQELAIKNNHLTQLHFQLNHYERASHEQINQIRMQQILEANLQELGKECHKALERASLAEEVLKKRDAEVCRLRGHLQSLEEGVRIERELQTRITLLQMDKDSALGEGQVLLAQLARRDKEVTKHCKEAERLQAAVAQLADQQTSQQKLVENKKVDHQAQVQDLQEKLQEAYSKDHSSEVHNIQVQSSDGACITEQCSGLGHGRQNILVELHSAVEGANLASQCGEELQTKLHCTKKEQVKAFEDVAGNTGEHLKRLTGDMEQLEPAVDQTGFCVPVLILQKSGLAKISAKLAEAAEIDKLNVSTRTDMYEHNERPRRPHDLDEGRKSARFSFGNYNKGAQVTRDRSPSKIAPLQDGSKCNVPSISQLATLTKLKNWTAWKWRWAASAARADSFQKNTVKMLEFLRNHKFLPDEKRLGTLLMKHKLVPLILSAWRAFTRMSILEREAIRRNKALNKIMLALPWWIRRVGERRLVERYFFHWQLLALRANWEKSKQGHKKKLVPYMNSISQSRVRDRGREQPQMSAQVQISRPAPPMSPSLHDVEVQTSQEADKGKRKTTLTYGATAAATQFLTPQPAKSEPNTAMPCPVCDIHPRSRGGVQQKQPMTGSRTLQVSHKLDSHTVNGVDETTFTARALSALQSSLQQELRELQILLSQEMQGTQQKVGMKEEDRHGTVCSADVNGQALKSVFQMCNNLAQELTHMRSQMSNAELPWGSGAKVSEHKWEGGKGSKTTDKLAGRPSTSGGMKTPRYASPIGRGKGVHFNSLSCHGHESTHPKAQAWNTPSGSPTTPRELREARFKAASMNREFCDIRAHRDRQNVNEDHSRSGRQSLQEWQERGQYFTSSCGTKQGDRVRLTEKVTKAIERDDEDAAMCAPSRFPQSSDQTKVVQILNQENDKLGEVGIHTSAVAGGITDSRTSEREARGTENQNREVSERLYNPGRTADRCTSAREAILTEDQDREMLRGHNQHTSQRHRTRQQWADESSYQHHRSQWADKSLAPGQSILPDRPHHHSTVAKHVDRNHTTDSSPSNFSEKRKKCIGSQYANLLESEVLRLREGRLMIEEDEFVDLWQGGDTTPHRELTRHSSLVTLNKQAALENSLYTSQYCSRK